MLLHNCKNNSAFEKKDGLLSQKLIDLNEDTLFLNEIVKEKCLIFRYSILSCNSCIDSIFYYIRENEEILGDLHIHRIDVPKTFPLNHLVFNLKAYMKSKKIRKDITHLCSPF